MTKQAMEAIINNEVKELDEMMKREAQAFEETQDETTRDMHKTAWHHLSQRKHEALIIRYSLFGY